MAVQNAFRNATLRPLPKVGTSVVLSAPERAAVAETAGGTDHVKKTVSVTLDDGLRSPKYVQVYSVLKDWIQQGVYAPGARLPSESELCDVFGVSRITTRSAVDMLVQEKLVDRIQGRGTFVGAVDGDIPSRGDLSELVRRLRQLDGRSSLSEIEISETEADDTVARDLQIAPRDKVLKVSYTRSREGEPTGATDIYIPARLNVTITPEDVMASPAPTLLESKGFDILGAHQFIGAALADTRIATQLKTNVGAPIVQVRLLLLDLNSRPIEMLTANYRADRYVHHVFLVARPGTHPAP